MKNTANQELKEKLKHIPPETMTNYGLLTPARKNGFVCPFCGNGSGTDGTGIDMKLLNSGYQGYCFRCDKTFDIFDIVANKLHLDVKTDFTEILKETEKIFCGVQNNPAEKPADTKKPEKNYLEDIKRANSRLKAFVDAQGGSWRGLTYETLNQFNCGYEPNFETHWQDSNKTWHTEKSPRVIIPTNDYHFLARLIGAVDDLNISDESKANIKPKQHKGTKSIFGKKLALEHLEHYGYKCLFVVEGEIDAMSVYQSRFAAISFCGSDISEAMKKEIIDFPKDLTFMIMFDNDETGKQKAYKIKKILHELKKRAVIVQLDENYNDPNEKLQAKGREELQKELSRIWIAQSDKDRAEKALLLPLDEREFLFNPNRADLDNAKRLLHFFGDRIRYETDAEKWLKYDNPVWKYSGGKNSALFPFAQDLSKIIAQNATDDNDEQKLARQWKMKNTFTNSIELLKSFSDILITAEDLNTHKNLLNCKNGVIDLETGKLYPHNAKLLLTQCVNADYIPDCRDEILDKFFHSILPDDDTLQALLRFLGYSLTGNVNEEKVLFIHGTGGNGKGTLTKMLLNLFADYGCSFPIEAVLANPRVMKDADTATPAFAKLLWQRLAIADEIPASRKLEAAKFKILSAGDPVPIRKLFQDATEIKDPTHKMIFSGNHLPELDDVHDPGILRRWLQIKFEQDFTGSNCDTNLKQKLLTNKVMQALLSMLVEQSIAWYKDGLIISDKMERAKREYFTANDFITEFISEYCEVGEGFEVKRKAFLTALKEEYPNETRGMSDRALTEAIKKIDGITYQHDNHLNAYVFKGIGLKNSVRQENLGDDFIPPPEYDN